MIGLLSACSRTDYVTWNCKGVYPNKESFQMILDGSSMQLEKNRLKFCGSMGHSTFFDASCPAQIEKSQVIFIPKKGDFIQGTDAFRCVAF